MSPKYCIFLQILKCVNTYYRRKRKRLSKIDVDFSICYIKLFNRVSFIISIIGIMKSYGYTYLRSLKINNTSSQGVILFPRAAFAAGAALQKDGI